MGCGTLPGLGSVLEMPHHIDVHDGARVVSVELGVARPLRADHAAVGRSSHHGEKPSCANGLISLTLFCFL